MTESSPPDVAQLVPSIADMAEAVAPTDYETLNVVGVFDYEEATGVDAHAVVAGQRVPLRVGVDVLDRFDEMRKRIRRRSPAALAHGRRDRHQRTVSRARRLQLRGLNLAADEDI